MTIIIVRAIDTFTHVTTPHRDDIINLFGHR